MEFSARNISLVFKSGFEYNISLGSIIVLPGVTMENGVVKRNIGVIPPHQTRHKGFIESFSKVVMSSYEVVPDTRFFNISFKRLSGLSSKGFKYDVVVAARMKDEADPEANNVYAAANEIRNRLSQNTIFILSFNLMLAKMKGMDLEGEKRQISKVLEHQNDPARPILGGIIYTTSTEPNFLISIVADVLDNPGKYLEKKQVYPIESQAHFLNHPPGQTQVGFRQ